MRNQKALTFIAVFLGVLVLYCLMNHREGFALPPNTLTPAQKAAALAASISSVKTSPGVVTQL